MVLDSVFPHKWSLLYRLRTGDFHVVKLLLSVSFWRHQPSRNTDGLKEVWLRVTIFIKSQLSVIICTPAGPLALKGLEGSHDNSRKKLLKFTQCDSMETAPSKKHTSHVSRVFGSFQSKGLPPGCKAELFWYLANISGCVVVAVWLQPAACKRNREGSVQILQSFSPGGIAGSC